MNDAYDDGYDCNSKQGPGNVPACELVDGMKFIRGDIQDILRWIPENVNVSEFYKQKASSQETVTVKNTDREEAVCRIVQVFGLKPDKAKEIVGNWTRQELDNFLHPDMGATKAKKTQKKSKN